MTGSLKNETLDHTVNEVAKVPALLKVIDICFSPPEMYQIDIHTAYSIHIPKARTSLLRTLLQVAVV